MQQWNTDLTLNREPWCRLVSKAWAQDLWWMLIIYREYEALDRKMQEEERVAEEEREESSADR